MNPLVSNDTHYVTLIRQLDASWAQIGINIYRVERFGDGATVLFIISGALSEYRIVHFDAQDRPTGNILAVLKRAG